MNLRISVSSFLFVLLLSHANLQAQVNGPGPSDSSLFTNVIDIPPASVDPVEILPPNDPLAEPPNPSVGGVPGETTQVNLMDGGEIGDRFEANFGSEINISGGTIGQEFSPTDGSEVNVLDGRVPDIFAMPGSVVNITGGIVDMLTAVGSDVTVDGGDVPVIFEVRSNSLVNLTSGNFVGGLGVFGSEVNIAGGDFGSAIWLEESELNVSGGNFDEFNSLILAFPESEVNLLGTQFLLDGVDLDLQVGETLTIPQRNVSLTGLFADGTEFEFQLSDSLPAVEFDFFSPEATLTVTVVPEPNACELLFAVTLMAGHLLRRRRPLTCERPALSV